MLSHLLFVNLCVHSVSDHNMHNASTVGVDYSTL